MAIYKSDLISMVQEGKSRVLDKVAVFHKNVSDSATGSLLVIGISDGDPYPLIYSDGTSYTGGHIVPASNWYRITSISDGTSIFPTGSAVGECYYTGSTGAVLDTGSASDDEATAIGGYELNTHADYDTQPTMTLIQSKAIPLEALFYWMEDCENLRSLYDVILISKLATAVPAGNTGDG